MKQNFEDFLGGIERNSTGHIIKARSTIMKWVLKANLSSEKTGASQYGLDDQVLAFFIFQLNFLSLSVETIVLNQG